MVGVVASVFVLGAAAPGAAAQSQGNGFLFKKPVATLAVHAGFAHARAGSDIFSFTTSNLTVNQGDFSGFQWGADLAYALSPRFDVALGVSHAGSTTPSEFRAFVDQNDLPIQQRTTFERVPVTASLEMYLGSRGREVGHYAWIPSRVAPYIGVGGGATWYRFRQRGDFVDANTLDIFTADLRSTGWAPEAHALAGVKFALGPRFLLTGEGRYTWARAGLSQDFIGFHKIDLSGVSVTAGVGVRF